MLVDRSGRAGNIGRNVNTASMQCGCVLQVLQEKGHFSIAKQYEDHLRLMANSGVTMFYVGRSKHNHHMFQDWIRIKDPYSSVIQSNYAMDNDCVKTPQQCAFEQDYPQAEPLLLFLYLYGNWTTTNGVLIDKDAVWRTKSSNSWPSYFAVNQSDKVHHEIVYERGLRFLTHEIFKYILLPYFDVPMAEAVFLNGERVRSHYSNMHHFPGMFSSAARIGNDSDYYADETAQIYPGIMDSLKKHALIMPYSAFAMLLHPQTRSHGVVWYANMLNSAVSQSTFGVLDSIAVTGTVS